MNTPPETLGKHLLVAISDHPDSLNMIRIIAKRLPDLEHTHVTLMHYLAPIYWEHSGGTEPEQAEAIRREEELVEEEEVEEERESKRYFRRARAILKDAGVPADNIHTDITFDEQNVAEAVLDEIEEGHYSGVVIGSEHNNVLAGLMGGTLADTIRDHIDNVTVWVVEDEPES